MKINVEEVATFEWAVRMNEDRHLEKMWARAIKVEMRANILEVVLTNTLEG